MFIIKHFIVLIYCKNNTKKLTKIILNVIAPTRRNNINNEQTSIEDIDVLQIQRWYLHIYSILRRHCFHIKQDFLEYIYI